MEQTVTAAGLNLIEMREDKPLNLLETSLLLIGVGSVAVVLMSRVTSVLHGFAHHGVILVPSGPLGIALVLGIGGLVAVSLLGAVHARSRIFKPTMPVLGVVLAFGGFVSIVLG